MKTAVIQLPDGRLRKTRIHRVGNVESCVYGTFISGKHVASDARIVATGTEEEIKNQFPDLGKHS